MTFYMALTPPDELAPVGQTDHDVLEKAVILKDGFSFPAFLLTGVWLLYKRLWWPFALFVAVWVAAAWGLPKLGLPQFAIAWVQVVIGLFLGHEGHALLERKLVNNGWTLEGVIEARDMDAAERRFFELALQDAPLTAPPAAPQRFFAATAGSPIIGLFPQAVTRPPGR
jgi:hypothetical protein